jgi:hypothetical protein
VTHLGSCYSDGESFKNLPQASRLLKMTKLLRVLELFSMEKGPLHRRNFVIATGA